VKAIVTDALLVRQVAYGESDVIATFFTEAEGRLTVMARGGRKSSKRIGGSLEPFHTVEARIDDRGGDLGTLREARIVAVRAGIVQSLEAIDAAGIALRWVRHACPPRTREPETWRTLVSLLDELDACHARGVPPRVVLARGAIRLLADVGYGLDLERCVRCGKECPPDRAARVDPARGGLLCSSCGEAKVPLSATLRAKVLSGDPSMSPADAERVLALVDAAMAAHAGFDR
jgi:DNA repair protein RecO (recombination protein O)